MATIVILGYIIVALIFGISQDYTKNTPLSYSGDRLGAYLIGLLWLPLIIFQILVYILYCIYFVPIKFVEWLWSKRS